MTVAPILRATHVARTPDDAFRLFTDHLGAWWPLTTHSVLDGRSVSVGFVDGQIVERTLDGDERLWGTVTAWEPPVRVVFSWHPGRTADEATEVEVRFLGDEHGTRVELEHRGWDLLADGADRRLGYTGPSAWGAVLDHYADLADRPHDEPAIEALRAGYAAFRTEASAGGFEAPPEGEWTAEQVVAHVALNDASMAAVCRRLIDQREVSFENAIVQDPAVLDRWIADRPMGALVADAEQAGEDYLLVLARLDDDQLDTEVACRLVDHGAVVLEGALPWRRLAQEIQASVHLPGHTAQLAALR